MALWRQQLEAFEALIAGTTEEKGVIALGSFELPVDAFLNICFGSDNVERWEFVFSSLLVSITYSGENW